MNSHVINQGQGIQTIDTGYHRPGLVASHLIQAGDQYAFVDVGTTTCQQRLLDALNAQQIRAEQVRYILVTHVHLDHAGAAGSLMRLFPEAQLVVHPRGARHMVDPTKLIEGATAVYGEKRMRETFGEILPVAKNRVIETADEMVLDVNGRELLFLDTPGHARHHYCVYDETSNGFFTGDTFGLSYQSLRVDGEPFMFPTTTPVQFDPDALHASLDRLISYKPKQMFLTHFGRVEEPRRQADKLHKLIDQFVAIAHTVQGEECEHVIYQGLRELLFNELQQIKSPLDEASVLTLMEMDLQLNTQGLCYWVSKGS